MMRPGQPPCRLINDEADNAVVSPVGSIEEAPGRVDVDVSTIVFADMTCWKRGDSLFDGQLATGGIIGADNYRGTEFIHDVGEWL